MEMLRIGYNLFRAEEIDIVENYQEPKSNYILKPCLQSHSEARHPYKGLAMMEYIHLSFSMLLVGTYALTKKKSRPADHFPFAKLSNGALKHL
jgi:hypothetical protein